MSILKEQVVIFDPSNNPITVSRANAYDLVGLDGYKWAQTAQPAAEAPADPEPVAETPSAPEAPADPEPVAETPKPAAPKRAPRARKPE